MTCLCEVSVDYKLFINGKWIGTSNTSPVYNKYDDTLIGTLAVADTDLVDEAIQAAERAAQVMADMPAHKRATILLRTAQLLNERREEIARTIAAEAGKALKFGGQMNVGCHRATMSNFDIYRKREQRMMQACRAGRQIAG